MTPEAQKKKGIESPSNVEKQVYSKADIQRDYVLLKLIK